MSGTGRAAAQPPPKRVRVTSPRRERHRPRPGAPADRGDRRADRARRGLHALAACAPSCGSALRCSPRPRCCSAGCRCCSSPSPAAQRAAGAGRSRCPGCCWACCVYPVVVLAALVLRPARRARSSATSPTWSTALPRGLRRRPTASAGRRRRWSAVATLAIGAFGLRLSRTTTDFYVASRTVSPALERLGHRRRVPLGRLASSASPAWCSPSAPTCCGSRSATPPATSCCWSWSPRRCAAPAPTRCRTSPRPGCESRGRAPALRRCWCVGHRLALPAAAVPGRRAGPARRHRRAALARVALVVARRGPGQRGRGRHALDHVRAGVPVLAQADRDQRPGLPAALALGPRRPADATRARLGPGSGLVAARCSGFGGRRAPRLRDVRTLLALFFGTMGLPHVLVRFYTNPDGRAARRTTLVGARPARRLLPVPAPVRRARPGLRCRDLPTAGRTDTVVLLLPAAVMPGPGRRAADRAA